MSVNDETVEVSNQCETRILSTYYEFDKGALVYGGGREAKEKCPESCQNRWRLIPPFANLGNTALFNLNVGNP